jgi:O-antigen/teichoic acid export membrane protein
VTDPTPIPELEVALPEPGPVVPQEPILVATPPEPGPAVPIEPGHASILSRLLRYRRLLRLRPFDTSTPEGRSAERYRRVGLSTAASTLARVISLGTSFIAIPLVIGYLGNERYGMWLTMSSLVAALGPLDLGIGLGVLTIVSEAHGRDDRVAARRAISTAAAVLSLIAAVAALAFAIAYPFVAWDDLFNVSSTTAVAEAGPASAVLFAAFALGLPLGIVAQVQLAYQSGYISSGWAIAGNLTSFSLLMVTIALHGSLPLLVLALTWVNLGAAAMNGWFLFRRQKPWLSPRLADINLRVARPLLKTGSLFLVLQLAGLVAYQLDNFIISQLLGAAAVPEYAVPAKLFYLFPTLLSFALTPLWPAYREAIARGDSPWVKRTLRRSLLLAAAVNIPNAVVMVAAGPWILNIWVGSAVHPTPILMLGLGAWALMNTVNGPFAVLLNGANVIGFQAVSAVFMAAANVILSILLIQRIGVAGAVWGSVIAQVFFSVIPVTWYVRRLLRRLATTGPQAAAS